jgi:hypothetical protein
VVIEDYPSLDCWSINDWMNRYHARLIADIPFEKNGHYDVVSHVYVLQLKPPASGISQ